MNDRVWLLTAAGLGFAAVTAGAFGSHGLEAAGDGHGARLVEVGARYQLVHALAIIAVLALRRPATAALWLWAAGAVLFPFSLYALALGAPRIVGLATPIGGTALLLGWAALAWSAFRAPA